jgi:hypothetical protein
LKGKSGHTSKAALSLIPGFQQSSSPGYSPVMKLLRVRLAQSAPNRVHLLEKNCHQAILPQQRKIMAAA